MHQWRIYESVKWVIINSSNGLSFSWCQANTWTDDDVFSVGRLKINFNEICIKIKLSFKKMNFVSTVSNILSRSQYVSPVGSEGTCRHFADIIFKCILPGKPVFVLRKKKKKKAKVEEDLGYDKIYFLRKRKHHSQFLLKEIEVRSPLCKNIPLGPVSLIILARNSNLMETVIPLLAIRLQHIFEHAAVAQLSCHIQNFVAIPVLESKWEWNEFSIEFEMPVFLLIT